MISQVLPHRSCIGGLPWRAVCAAPVRQGRGVVGSQDTYSTRSLARANLVRRCSLRSGRSCPLHIITTCCHDCAEPRSGAEGRTASFPPSRLGPQPSRAAMPPSRCPSSDSHSCSPVRRGLCFSPCGISSYGCSRSGRRAGQENPTVPVWWGVHSPDQKSIALWRRRLLSLPSKLTLRY